MRPNVHMKNTPGMFCRCWDGRKHRPDLFKKFRVWRRPSLHSCPNPRLIAQAWAAWLVAQWHEDALGAVYRTLLCRHRLQLVAQAGCKEGVHDRATAHPNAIRAFDCSSLLNKDFPWSASQAKTTGRHNLRSEWQHLALYLCQQDYEMPLIEDLSCYLQSSLIGWFAGPAGIHLLQDDASQVGFSLGYTQG